METLIIHLKDSVDKAKMKSVLKLMKGVKSVSDKIAPSDCKEMADDILIKEMKKADKSPLLSYEGRKKEFSRLKNGQQNHSQIPKSIFGNSGNLRPVAIPIFSE